MIRSYEDLGDLAPSVTLHIGGTSGRRPAQRLQTRSTQNRHVVVMSIGSMDGLFLQLNRLIAAIDTSVRPARRPHQRFGPWHYRIQVGEDLCDDVGILDARDDPYCSAWPASPARGTCCSAQIPRDKFARSESGCTQCARRGAPRRARIPTGEVDPRLRHQRRQPGNEVEGFDLELATLHLRRLLTSTAAGPACCANFHGDRAGQGRL